MIMFYILIPNIIITLNIGRLPNFAQPYPETFPYLKYIKPIKDKNYSNFNIFFLPIPSPNERMNYAKTFQKTLSLHLSNVDKRA